MLTKYYTLHNPLTDFADIFPKQDAKNYSVLWKKYLGSDIKHNHPLIIVLTGPSSSGKSSLCLEVAYRLGVRHIISTDVIRRTLRSVSNKEENPALFLASYDCWRAHSEVYTPEAHVKGFKEQCSIVTPFIVESIKEAIGYGKVTIVEGLHILPSLMPEELSSKREFIHIILDVPSENVHKDMFENRKHSTYLKSCNLPSEGKPVFNNFRTLRDLFVEESKNKAFLVRNDGSRAVLSNILEVIFQRVDQLLLNEQRGVIR